MQCIHYVCVCVCVYNRLVLDHCKIPHPSELIYIVYCLYVSQTLNLKSRVPGFHCVHTRYRI